MESKKISQLATELTPSLSDLTIIGDPTTGISKKITLSQMASLFTGTVEEYANLAAFPLVGVADTIYIALDTNILYRWDTSLSTYVVLSPNIINSLVFSDANGFDGTITLVGSVATLSITTALTLGSVPFIGASGALTQDNSNLFFDDTNNRLGIATASPTTPLDVFGSGIIGRLNATSTNNAFLGFASNGTNKWSAGNVQSDHRFRIYNEAATSELFTILPTGEIGIGIANPTTKFHIDGGASALIANLDANVSVAKSISFRSDNSNRINLEVSGTESGSNAGADFFLRTFTDAGALLETPFQITRSTGASTFSGNVAIGATFSAWISTAKVLQINNTASLFAPTSEVILANNLFVDSTDNNKYITTNFASQYRQVNGQHIFYTAASGTAGNTISLTTALTIGSSGDVGVGISGAYGKFHVAGGDMYIGLYHATNKLCLGGDANQYIRYNSTLDGLELAGYQGMTFTTLGGNERFRVLADGQFCMNTQVALTAGWLSISVNSNNYNAIVLRDTGTTYSAGNYYQVFTNSSNTISGSISHNTLTGVNFNTSSDYRLKEDFKDFNGLDILSNIKFYDFKWKNEDKRMHGVIAHELESLIPLAVSGIKDAIDKEGNIVAQGVDYSKIVPIIGKALQEAMLKIKALEEKVKQLELK